MIFGRHQVLASAATALAWASVCAAGPAVLIQSKSLDPYERASSAFEESFAGPLRRFVLDAEPRSETVKEIRRLEPGLLVAVGTDALRVASEEFPSRPLVFLMVLDAQRYHSHSGPIAGVTLEVPAAGCIAALQALRPDLRTIGVIYDPSESGLAVARLDEAAGLAGLALVARMATSARDAMSAMPDLFRECDAFIILPDATTACDPCVELAVLLSLRHHVPLLAPSRKYIERGATAALGVDFEDVGAQAAELAARLLRGDVPGGVEGPRLLTLLVNERTSSKLGLRPPLLYAGRPVEVIP
jgi:putative ABC transport system substrate-binding protein